MKYLENWADILLNNMEELGHPVNQHTVMSTEELNLELRALSFGKKDSLFGDDHLKACMDEWYSLSIEVIPFTHEAYNQDLRALSGLEQKSTRSVQFPIMRNPVVLSKVC